ncbi:MAG: chloride channel protein, partial [Chthoniobacteraceae bacterium]
AMYRHSFHLGVFSLGYDDLTLALQGGLEWKLAVLLLVGKFIATSVCYGFGGCGGIFSPSLFFGGLCGVIMASGFAHVFGLNSSDQSLLAIGGMSACLGAVVQAPVTAVIIIFEMTHQFSIVPGLMIAGLVSQLIARSCSHANFYEEVLLQDGHKMAHVIPPRDLRSWQNLPISAVAHFDPICVRDLGEETVRKLFQEHPYQRFPIIADGRLSGILMRAETERAWKDGLPPMVHPATTIAPGTTIRDSQRELIDSGIGLVVITEPAKNRPLAVVTLHDLLRAQVSLAERDG